MSEALVPCPACHRHVRASEPACPFCAGRPSPTGARSAAWLLASAALAGVLAHGAPAEAQPSPRLGMEHAPAQGYGAPPMYDPGRIGIPGPAVDPEPTAGGSRVTLDARVLSTSDPRGAARVRAYLSSQRAALSRCVDLAAGRTPRRVELRATFTVLPSGEVTAARVSSSARSPSMIACMTDALARVRVRGRPSVDAPTRVMARLTAVIPAAITPPRTPRSPGRGVATVGSGGADRCVGPSPAGCRTTGCGPGLVCDRQTRCVPSSCGCDPSTGRWTCTSDCGGGVCVPPGAVGGRGRGLRQ
ncbi:MAG: hypothetical protein Q8S73_41255 [Deltaproteobacteria bacterium]|nr:hypothetical protein [Myxococcales bacterium]MDP3220589.1 hypothetical protein [Deltaproteobacteria bacterium]